MRVLEKLEEGSALNNAALALFGGSFAAGSRGWDFVQGVTFSAGCVFLVADVVLYMRRVRREEQEDCLTAGKYRIAPDHYATQSGDMLHVAKLPGDNWYVDEIVKWPK